MWRWQAKHFHLNAPLGERVKHMEFVVHHSQNSVETAEEDRFGTFGSVGKILAEEEQEERERVSVLGNAGWSRQRSRVKAAAKEKLEAMTGRVQDALMDLAGPAAAKAPAPAPVQQQVRSRTYSVEGAKEHVSAQEAAAAVLNVNYERSPRLETLSFIA